MGDLESRTDGANANSGLPANNVRQSYSWIRGPVTHGLDIFRDLYRNALELIPPIPAKHSAKLLALFMVLVAVVITILIVFAYRSLHLISASAVEPVVVPAPVETVQILRAPPVEADPPLKLTPASPTSQTADDGDLGVTDPQTIFVKVNEGKPAQPLRVYLDRLRYFEQYKSWRAVPEGLIERCMGPESACVNTAQVLRSRAGEFLYGCYRLAFEAVDAQNRRVISPHYFNYSYKPDVLAPGKALRPNRNRSFDVRDGQVLFMKQKPTDGFSSADITTPFDFRDRIVVAGAFFMRYREEANTPSLRVSLCNRWEQRRGQVELRPVLSVCMPDGHPFRFSVRTVEDDQRMIQLKAQGHSKKALEKLLDAVRRQISTDSATTVDISGKVLNCFLIRVCRNPRVSSKMDCELYVKRETPPKLGKDLPIHVWTFDGPLPFREQKPIGVQLSICKGAEINVLHFEIAEHWDDAERQVLLADVDR